MKHLANAILKAINEFDTASTSNKLARFFTSDRNQLVNFLKEKIRQKEITANQPLSNELLDNIATKLQTEYKKIVDSKELHTNYERLVINLYKEFGFDFLELIHITKKTEQNKKIDFDSIFKPLETKRTQYQSLHIQLAHKMAELVKFLHQELTSTEKMIKEQDQSLQGLKLVNIKNSHGRHIEEIEEHKKAIVEKNKKLDEPHTQLSLLLKQFHQLPHDAYKSKDYRKYYDDINDIHTHYKKWLKTVSDWYDNDRVFNIFDYDITEIKRSDEATNANGLSLHQ